MASIDIFFKLFGNRSAFNKINPYMHFENIHIIIFDFWNKQVKQLNIHTVEHVQIEKKRFT